MKRRWIRFFGIALITGSLFTCIEPFNIRLDDNLVHLVIDALFTDDIESSYVKLSRTKVTLNGPSENVTGAVVSIKDDSDNIIIFKEYPGGIYKTDNPALSGQPGKTYTLSVKTREGREYISEPCIMHPACDIDTLYFGRDQVTGDDGEIQEGLMVYIDARDLPENSHLRWAYEEWWEFNIPTPKSYVYVNQRNIYGIPIENVTCWKNKLSTEIIIGSSVTVRGGEFIKKPVLFIPSNKSDRLLIQYFIQVNQFSLSADDYEFWNNLKQINETGGDIFDKQPFRIKSNIQNVNDPGENVLGYFQVSSVRHVSKYFTRKEFNEMHLPYYYYDCIPLVVGPGDDEARFISPPITFDKIYNYFTELNYTFTSPSYNEFGQLEKLIFVKEECADCSLTGSTTKPDFWIDLK